MISNLFKRNNNNTKYIYNNNNDRTNNNIDAYNSHNISKDTINDISYISTVKNNRCLDENPNEMVNDYLEKRNKVFGKRDYKERDTKIRSLFDYFGNDIYKQSMSYGANRDNRTLKTLQVNFSNTISAAGFLVINPSDLARIMYFIDNTTNNSVVFSNSISNKLSDFYVNYRFRAMEVVIKNLSKETSTVDNKLNVDAVIVETSNQYSQWIDYMEECPVTNPSIMDYDLFNPLCAKLYNVGKVDSISIDNNVFTTDKSTIMTFSGIVTQIPLNNGNLVNIRSRIVKFTVNIATTINTYRLNTAGNFVGVSTFAAAVGVNFVSPGPFSHISSSAAAFVEVLVLEQIDDLDQQLVLRIDAPASPAVVSVVMNLVYECEMKPSLKSELQYSEVFNEFDNILDNEGLCGKFGTMISDRGSVYAGTFSNALKWLTNKIPYVGKYVSKGVDWLDKQDYLSGKVSAALELPEVKTPITWIDVDAEGLYKNPYHPYIGYEYVEMSEEPIEGMVCVYDENGLASQIVAEDGYYLISKYIFKDALELSDKMKKKYLMNYGIRIQEKVKASTILDNKMEKELDKDKEIILISPPTKNATHIIDVRNDNTYVKNKQGFLVANTAVTPHILTIRSMAIDGVLVDISADSRRLQALSLREGVPSDDTISAQFFPVVLELSGKLEVRIYSIVRTSVTSKVAGVRYRDYIEIGNSKVFIDELLVDGYKEFVTAIELYYALVPPTADAYYTVHGHREYYRNHMFIPDSNKKEMFINLESIYDKSWVAAAIACLISAPNFQYFTGCLGSSIEDVCKIDGHVVELKSKGFGGMPLIVLGKSDDTTIPYTIDYQFFNVSASSSVVFVSSLMSFMFIARYPIASKGYKQSIYTTLGLNNEITAYNPNESLKYLVQYLANIVYDPNKGNKINYKILDDVVHSINNIDPPKKAGKRAITINVDGKSFDLSYNTEGSSSSGIPIMPRVLFTQLNNNGSWLDAKALINTNGYNFILQFGNPNEPTLAFLSRSAGELRQYGPKYSGGVNTIPGKPRELADILGFLLPTLGLTRTITMDSPKEWAVEKDEYPAFIEQSVRDKLASSSDIRDNKRSLEKLRAYNSYATNINLQQFRNNLTSTGATLSVASLKQMSTNVSKAAGQALTVIFNILFKVDITPILEEKSSINLVRRFNTMTMNNVSEKRQNNPQSLNNNNEMELDKMGANLVEGTTYFLAHDAINPYEAVNKRLRPVNNITDNIIELPEGYKALIIK